MPNLLVVGADQKLGAGGTSPAPLPRSQLNWLARRSQEILKEGQAPSGALVACPTFPVYRYCWLRDGAFCAHALGRTGHREEATAFFRWVGRVLSRYEARVENLIERYHRGETLSETDFLNTRYTLEGEEEQAGGAGGEDWWNFQLDGYGTWLWALAEHFKRYPDEKLRQELRPAVELTVRYLSAFWRLPNFDCWEENRHDIHPATLSALYGGLVAARQSYPESKICQAGRRQASAIRLYINQHGLYDGGLVKSVGHYEVDASLLGAAVPYELFPLRGQVMQSTIARIANELVAPDGGVYRYRKDVYYGGGEWLLLTAWLGWYYARTGQRRKALNCLQWVAGQADAEGKMPEQVAHHLLAPDHRAGWERRWGISAKPLLWSHAMYLILYTALYGEG
jgi:GH15 family glucan-1,4-alpha-glucosidase